MEAKIGEFLRSPNLGRSILVLIKNSVLISILEQIQSSQGAIINIFCKNLRLI